MNRRQFIKTGVMGSAALAAVGAWYGYRHHGAGRIEGPALDEDSLQVVAAVAAVLLQGVLAPQPQGAAQVRSVVEGVQRAVAGLAAAAQKEVRQLFALLTFAPTRSLVAGVGAPWADAGADEVAAFLHDWRYSRFELLRAGYAVLHDLTFGAWYGGPAGWERIGYPGPPEML